MRVLKGPSAERVGEAINLGTAIGLVPGIILAAVVFATRIGT
jgi:hypothetical protein